MHLQAEPALHQFGDRRADAAELDEPGQPGKPAALSANGEKHPQWAWNLNMGGLLNVLELARTVKLKQVFWPSSIAAFGPTTPATATQHTVMDPTTVYGISKLAGEDEVVNCAAYQDGRKVEI